MRAAHPAVAAVDQVKTALRRRRLVFEPVAAILEGFHQRHLERMRLEHRGEHGVARRIALFMMRLAGHSMGPALRNA